MKELAGSLEKTSPWFPGFWNSPHLLWCDLSVSFGPSLLSFTGVVLSRPSSSCSLFHTAYYSGTISCVCVYTYCLCMCVYIHACVYPSQQCVYGNPVPAPTCPPPCLCQSDPGISGCSLPGLSKIKRREHRARGEASYPHPSWAYCTLITVRQTLFQWESSWALQWQPPQNLALPPNHRWFLLGSNTLVLKQSVKRIKGDVCSYWGRGSISLPRSVGCVCYCRLGVGTSSFHPTATNKNGYQLCVLLYFFIPDWLKIEDGNWPTARLFIQSICGYI